MFPGKQGINLPAVRRIISLLGAWLRFPKGKAIYFFGSKRPFYSAVSMYLPWSEDLDFLSLQKCNQRFQADFLILHLETLPYSRGGT